MSQSPPKSLVVRGYDQLRQIVSSFRRDINFLLIGGRPGLGKSQVVDQTLSDMATMIRGAATPYGLFCEIFANRDDSAIVLDDIDGIFRDPKTWSLLKSLTESKAIKEIGWHSLAPIRDGLPTSFKTRARTVLIVNDWPVHNPFAAALADRAAAIDFQPTVHEIHREAERWFRAQAPEVFDFIGRHLELMSGLSFRTYLTAEQLRRTGGNLWQEFIRSGFMDETLAEVAALLDDSVRYQTDLERIAAFSGSSATFKRAKGKLKEAGLLPNPSRDDAATVKLSGAG